MSGKKILIVDDEPHIFLALQLEFEHSYSLFKAENITEAIEQARSIQPDLIILDIMMPENTASAGHIDPIAGIKVYNALKNDKLTSLIPVIFLSVKKDSIDLKGLRPEPYKKIGKPFNIDELVKAVNDLF